MATCLCASNARLVANTPACFNVSSLPLFAVFQVHHPGGHPAWACGTRQRRVFLGGRDPAGRVAQALSMLQAALAIRSRQRGLRLYGTCFFADRHWAPAAGRRTHHQEPVPHAAHSGPSRPCSGRGHSLVVDPRAVDCKRCASAADRGRCGLLCRRCGGANDAMRRPLTAGCSRAESRAARLQWRTCHGYLSEWVLM